MDRIRTTQLRRFALQIRIASLEQVLARGFGHVGGVLSVADLLAVLYGGEMKIDPTNPNWIERDKFICSKGHAGPAVYAALALKGYFPKEKLRTLNQGGTMLPSHCDRNKTPGVDMTTGSLGQGTSIAVGMALGEKLRHSGSRIFLLAGDGEINEGQPWEAAMFAAAHGLDNLFFFVDNNKRQLDGTISEILDTGDIREKFSAFGFNSQRVPGHDVAAIWQSIRTAEMEKGRPNAIILDTVKGAGVPEVESMASNHSISDLAGKAERWIAYLREQLTILEEEQA